MLESLFSKVADKNADLQLYLKETPVNVAKFLRTAFFTEHIRWLPLSV